MVLRAETGYPPRPDTPTPLPLPKKSRGVRYISVTIWPLYFAPSHLILYSTIKERKKMNPFRKHDTPFLLTLLENNRKALTHWMYQDDVETTELNILEITEVLTSRGVTL